MLDENERRSLERAMGFPGQWEEHRRFQIAFLRSQGLRPHHTLLEIGCGPLTAGLPLIKYLEPNKYTGVDIRHSVLDASWMQVGKNGLSAKNPRLVCSHSFGDDVLGSQAFDYVLSFSVLYHLSDDLLAECFASVGRRLNGPWFANVSTRNLSSRWLEFPFLQRSMHEYERMAAGLKLDDMGTIQSLGFRLPGIERENRLLRITASAAP